MKKKIFELAQDPDLQRREFWQQIPELAAFDFIEFKGSEEEFKTQWKTILKDAFAILLEEKYSSQLLHLLPQVSQRILEGQRIDAIFKDEHNNSWPQCLLRETLHEMIVKLAKNLDTSATAYVTGNGPMMRVALAVAVQLGYRKLYVVLKGETIPFGFEKELKRLYFDAQIGLMNHTDLTLQKNNGSLLINTLEFAANKDLSEDLSYLNFIFAGGLVVDTCHRQIKNALLDEAAHVGLQTINGGELQAGADWRFIKKLLVSVPMAQTEYTQKWLEFVKSTKNPPKVQ